MTGPSQEQRGGHHSTNIQIIHEALPQDAKGLILDIVHAELYRYRQDAEAEVSERMERIAERVVSRVALAGPQATAAFRDPDVQFSVGAVGRAYARTGDDNLADVLVDLLADRCAVEGRTLMAVVLNDAIETAARLTDSELAALSLAWRLLNTRWLGMNSLESLRLFLEEQVAPFVDALPEGEASFLHMQYLGCVGNLATTSTMGGVFLGAYPGLFTNGFAVEDLDAELLASLGEHQPKSVDEPGPFFIPCLRDRSLLQVNALFPEQLDDATKSHGVPDAALGLKALVSRNQMSPDAVQSSLRDTHPCVASLEAKWESSGLGSFRLTSVGMAIAHSNYRRVTGLSTPLSTWVS